LLIKQPVGRSLVVLCSAQVSWR